MKQPYQGFYTSLHFDALPTKEAGIVPNSNLKSIFYNKYFVKKLIYGNIRPNKKICMVQVTARKK